MLSLSVAANMAWALSLAASAAAIFLCFSNFQRFSGTESVVELTLLASSSSSSSHVTSKFALSLAASAAAIFLCFSNFQRFSGTESVVELTLLASSSSSSSHVTSKFASLLQMAICLCWFTKRYIDDIMQAIAIINTCNTSSAMLKQFVNKTYHQFSEFQPHYLI